MPLFCVNHWVLITKVKNKTVFKISSLAVCPYPAHQVVPYLLLQCNYPVKSSSVCDCVPPPCRAFHLDQSNMPPSSAPKAALIDKVGAAAAAAHTQQPLLHDIMETQKKPIRSH